MFSQTLREEPCASYPSLSSKSVRTVASSNSDPHLLKHFARRSYSLQTAKFDFKLKNSCAQSLSQPTCTCTCKREPEGLRTAAQRGKTFDKAAFIHGGRCMGIQRSSLTAGNKDTVFILRYVLRAPYPKTSVTVRLDQGSREMGLSAAVSVSCTVWKSSVMAYLMVIVWAGDSPPSCLHAGVSGVCVQATAVAVEEQQ
ncbi:hypothetical protein PAMP_012499 [Pampus punctatissimus]